VRTWENEKPRNTANWECERTKSREKPRTENVRERKAEKNSELRMRENEEPRKTANSVEYNSSWESNSRPPSQDDLRVYAIRNFIPVLTECVLS
jgi:hypothetical protein